MKIEFDPAQAIDWAAGQPTWALVLAGTHVWYLLAGVVIKWMGNGPGTRFADRSHQIFIWGISPVVFVIFCALWPAVSLSSGFLVSPPWRTKWRYTKEYLDDLDSKAKIAKAKAVHHYGGTSAY